MADKQKRRFDDSSSSSPSKKIKKTMKSDKKISSNIDLVVGSGSGSSNKKKFSQRTPPYESIVVYDLKKAKESLKERTSLTHVFVSMSISSEKDREEIRSMCVERGIYCEVVDGMVCEFDSYGEARRTASNLQKGIKVHVLIGPYLKQEDGDLIEMLCRDKEYTCTRIRG